jgi:hypothetical protein
MMMETFIVSKQKKGKYQTNKAPLHMVKVPRQASILPCVGIFRKGGLPTMNRTDMDIEPLGF